MLLFTQTQQNVYGQSCVCVCVYGTYMCVWCMYVCMVYVCVYPRTHPQINTPVE